MMILLGKLSFTLFNISSPKLLLSTSPWELNVEPLVPLTSLMAGSVLGNVVKAASLSLISLPPTLSSQSSNSSWFGQIWR